MEGIRVALELGEVRVHRRAVQVGKRLGHEGGVHPVELRDRFHDVAEGDNVVCHGERVGVAQVDLRAGHELEAHVARGVQLAA